jgi:hypothetical protein
MNLHISVISDSSTYIDTAFLPEIIESTQGTSIAPQSTDEVSADVLTYLGAEAGQRTIIVSSVSVKLLPEKFNSDYISKIASGTDEDYDEDGLTDDEEIDFDSPLLKNVDGNIILPRIIDCISYLNKVFGIENDITRVEKFALANNLPLASVMYVSTYSDPTSDDGDADDILDNVDIQPLHGNLDIPSELKGFINNESVKMNSIIVDDDGFSLCNTPISDILILSGISSNHQGFDVSGLYDDWYIYCINAQGRTTYSLVKMREIENSGYDSNDPGVTVSFVSFDIFKLIQAVNDKGLSIKKLDDEIDKVTYQSMVSSSFLIDYFTETKSNGSYIIAEAYIKKIIEITPGGYIPVPEKINALYTTYLNIGLDEKLFSKLNGTYRIVEFLIDLNKKTGRNLFDYETQSLHILDKDNLTYDEMCAIFATYLNNKSVFEFAWEVQFHAMITEIPTEITVEHGIRADMSVYSNYIIPQSEIFTLAHYNLHYSRYF